MTNIFLNIIILLAFVVFLATCRRTFKKWTHHVLLVAGINCALVFASLVLFGFDYISPLMPLTFLAFSFSFALPGFIKRRKISKTQLMLFAAQQDWTILRRKRLLDAFVIISILLAMIYPLLFVYKQGYNILSLFDMEVIYNLNVAAANDRYLNNGGNYSTILLIFLYIAPMMGGFYLSQKITTKRFLLSMATLIPCCFDMLLKNGKAVVLYSLCLYFAVLITYRISFFKKQKLPKSILVLGFIGVVVLGVGFVGSFVLRTGGKSGEIADFISKTLLYGFGSGAAFSEWIMTYQIFYSDFEWGAYTFAGIFNTFFGIGRESGIFTETVNISNWGVTNVYTLYRSLIEDFGLIGALFSFFLLGSASNYSYSKLSIGKNGFAFIYIGSLSLIFYSIYGSIFAYNSIIVGIMLFCLISSIFLERKRPELYINQC